MRDLTPYQTEIARAVVHDVLQARGGVFTVEMAEGAGTDELSAQVALLLLTLHVHDGGQLLRVVPSGVDDGADVLTRYLREGGLHGLWSARPGVVRLGRAECRYVTPEELGDVTGPVALIEVTEAQWLDRETWERYLAPLAVASNATVVLHGTPWNGETLFEELKQLNREDEGVGGPRRHFRVAWQEAAAAVPAYAERVEAARERLGENHPEFQTRYALRPVQPTGALLSGDQARALMGRHPRRHSVGAGTRTRAAVVVTRLPETTDARELLMAPCASAVVMIAEEPAGEATRVVETRWLQAPDTATLGRRLAKLLGETWRCERVIGDVSLVRGEQAFQLRRLLEHALPRVAIAWNGGGTRQESERALSLIAAANARRVALFAADGSTEYRVLRREVEDAVAEYGVDGLVRVRLPQREEGFLRALALVVNERASVGEHADARWRALAS